MRKKTYRNVCVAFLVFVAVLLVGVVSAIPAATPDFERAESHVVVLKFANGRGTCSGVAITRDTILTAAHCTDHGDITVLRRDAYAFPLKAEVLWSSGQKYEVALLKVDQPVLDPVRVRMSPLALGEAVFAVGHPFDIEWSVSQGHVSALSRDMAQISDGEITTADEVQLDLAINPGNSGGALFDAQGRLVGITNLKRPDSELLSFAVPMRVVRALIPNL